MTRGTRTAGVARATLIIAAFTAGAYLCGCTATCKRIENDRTEFFARKPEAKGPQAEFIVPFTVANELIKPKVAGIKPIDFDIPGLGQLGSYLGKLSVAPKKVELLPAQEGSIGFSLTFDVLDKGKRIFTTSASTEVKPEIDLKNRMIAVQFGPEAMKKVKMTLSKDAKKDLGNHVYGRLPAAAKFFLTPDMVGKGAATAVNSLMKNFYKVAKGPLLDKIEKESRMEFTLPEIPVEKLTLSSYEESGGGMLLLVETGLPVRKGLEPTDTKTTPPSDKEISARITGSALAELANWGIDKGHIPQRYTDKGKPKDDGPFRPGLDWVPGDHPMKIYLWKLEKPCMRLTMEADPYVEIKDGEVKIGAKNGEIKDIEAHAFTKAGVWFYTLWKDALKVTKKASTQMRFEVAGQKMVSEVLSAGLENDELKMGLSLVEDTGEDEAEGDGEKAEKDGKKAADKKK